MELLRTPLYERHIALHARMAPFAGYDMPISYDSPAGGMLKEHLAVRQEVGMFDVSHMGEFWIRGSEATAFLSYLCTRSFEKLADGRAQYCLLLNEQGTIIDDIIVYRFNAETYWMVVNASNIDKDFNHVKKTASGFKVEVENVSASTALIALQGPKAVEIISKFLPEAPQLKYYHFGVSKKQWIYGRTGYTGEDGFEIFLPPSDALELWVSFEKMGILPIGLGARDTLRLEVGFPLYGHELSDQLLPLETFSAFAVDLTKNFLGAEKARAKPRHKPVALVGSNPKPMRADESVYWGDKKVGIVTSGSTSPIKKLGIALALIDATACETVKNGDIFMLESAGKQREAVVTTLPFVATSRVKGSKPAATKVFGT